MAPFTLRSPEAQRLQASIQRKLAEHDYSAEDDAVMGEYITVMLANSKAPTEITAELTDLIGPEYKPALSQWFYDEMRRICEPATAPPPESTVAWTRLQQPEVAREDDRDRMEVDEGRDEERRRVNQQPPQPQQQQQYWDHCEQPPPPQPAQSAFPIQTAFPVDGRRRGYDSYVPGERDARQDGRTSVRQRPPTGPPRNLFGNAIQSLDSAAVGKRKFAQMDVLGDAPKRGKLEMDKLDGQPGVARPQTVPAQPRAMAQRSTIAVGGMARNGRMDGGLHIAGKALGAAARQQLPKLPQGRSMKGMPASAPSSLPSIFTRAGVPNPHANVFTPAFARNQNHHQQQQQQQQQQLNGPSVNGAYAGPPTGFGAKGMVGVPGAPPGAVGTPFGARPSLAQRVDPMLPESEVGAGEIRQVLQHVTSRALGQPAPTSISAPAPAVSPFAASPAAVTTTTTFGPSFAPKADKTVPSEPTDKALCKFASSCTNAYCRYAHPSPVADDQSGLVLSEDVCGAGEGGRECKDKDCGKSHVSPAVVKASVDGPPPSTSGVPCKFGQNCLNPSCSYLHTDANGNAVPSPALTSSLANHAAGVAAPSAFGSSSSSYTYAAGGGVGGDGKKPCRFGDSCTRPDCYFSHPRDAGATTTACKFGIRCHRPDCYFQHPPGRYVPPPGDGNGDGPSSTHISERPFGLATDGDGDVEIVLPGGELS